MTTANFIQRRRLKDFGMDADKAILSARDELADLGCVFFRASMREMTKEIIVEGWRSRPEEQGDLPL